jgi:midasin (ATPase involved in ribosome maturation)
MILTKMQPMMTLSRPSSSGMPFAHYALIYLDNEGKLKVDESASIQEQSSTIFTPEVRQNFLEILRECIGFQQPICCKLNLSTQVLGHFN